MVEERQLSLEEAPTEATERTWFVHTPQPAVIHLRSVADHTRTLCGLRITWGLYTVNGICATLNCDACRKEYEALDEEIRQIEVRHATTLAAPATP